MSFTSTTIKAISEDATMSLCHARDHIKGRFELGEKAISEDAFCSYNYARDVLKGRFELGEKTISKESHYSYWYSKDVIKGRFELGEESIKQSILKNDYVSFLKKILSKEEFILFKLGF